MVLLVKYDKMEENQDFTFPTILLSTICIFILMHFNNPSITLFVQYYLNTLDSESKLPRQLSFWPITTAHKISKDGLLNKKKRDVPRAQLKNSYPS